MKVINGTIISFNISPKGFYESFIMKNGKNLVQVNFPRGAGPDAAKDLHIGQTLTVNAKPFDVRRPSAHPVYEWIGDENKTCAGVVARINYALHGEPNGAILETGEFIHIKPDEAKAGALKVGQKLTVKGIVRLSPSGHVIIDAKMVNGVALASSKHKKKKAA